MSSITNLDGLFADAAADWDKKLPSGIMPTISVQVVVRSLGPWDPLMISGAPVQAKLDYTAEKKEPTLDGLPLLVPAFFYGGNAPNESGEIFTQLYVKMSPSKAGGYDVSIEVTRETSGVVPNPPITMAFNLASPGGQQGNSGDPLVDIFFAYTETSPITKTSSVPLTSTTNIELNQYMQ